jgi:hypothetical protein
MPCVRISARMPKSYWGYSWFSSVPVGKSLSQHLWDVVGDATRNLSQDTRYTGLRFKPGTSRNWNRCANHSITVFSGPNTLLVEPEAIHSSRYWVSSVYLTSYLSKINLNVVIPSLSGSSIWPFFKMLSAKIQYLCFSLILATCSACLDKRRSTKPEAWLETVDSRLYCDDTSGDLVPGTAAMWPRDAVHSHKGCCCVAIRLSASSHTLSLLNKVEGDQNPLAHVVYARIQMALANTIIKIIIRT